MPRRTGGEHPAAQVALRRSCGANSDGSKPGGGVRSDLHNVILAPFAHPLGRGRNAALTGAAVLLRARHRRGRSMHGGTFTAPRSIVRWPLCSPPRARSECYCRGLVCWFFAATVVRCSAPSSARSLVRRPVETYGVRFVLARLRHAPGRFQSLRGAVISVCSALLVMGSSCPTAEVNSLRTAGVIQHRPLSERAAIGAASATYELASVHGRQQSIMRMKKPNSATPDRHRRCQGLRRRCAPEGGRIVSTAWRSDTADAPSTKVIARTSWRGASTPRLAGRSFELRCAAQGHRSNRPISRPQLAFRAEGGQATATRQACVNRLVGGFGHHSFRDASGADAAWPAAEQRHGRRHRSDDL